MQNVHMRLMLAGLAGLLALGLPAAEPSGEGNGATLLGKKPYGIDGRMHLYRDFAYGLQALKPGERRMHGMTVKVRAR